MTDQQARVLVVDDRPANLLAIEAALEPLQVLVVRASSGPDALKQLLIQEFACILLDVQMPGMDGFETAELIKRRERTRSVPIIFLTAINKEQRHVFAGYEAGAIDYIFKPVDPEILRSKVSVLIDLWHSHQQLRHQQVLLAESAKQREIDALREASDLRYRTLADAMPQIVFTARADGHMDYFNRRWTEYTGLPLERSSGWDWSAALHDDDVETAVSAWRDAVVGGRTLHQLELRLRSQDGSYRWHLSRAVPVVDAEGKVQSWAGTLTDIDEHKRTQAIERFLGEATAVLASANVEIDDALGTVAGMATDSLVDVCSIDVLDAAGEELELQHVAGGNVAAAAEVHSLRHSSKRQELPPAIRHVLDTGRTAQAAAIDEGPLLNAWTGSDQQARMWRVAGVTGALAVPLRVRGETLGVLTALRVSEAFDERDVRWAETLAGRIAAAVEGVRLDREVARRARASQVLDAIGDGVLLLDQDGIVRLWNPAAEAITGLPADTVLGHEAAVAIPGWDDIAARVNIVSEPAAASAAETLPVEIGERELWLSVAGVGFSGGTVYAFRDLTESRRVDKMKSDFIATVSHELRTPLAAVYGAAKTIRRSDMHLDEDTREQLIDMISEQSERLATIVDDVLLASRLDADNQQVSATSVDGSAVAHEVCAAARLHAPENVDLQLDVPDGLPPVEADPQYLRQVLNNLVDNAIKYSPDGGKVDVDLEHDRRVVRFCVRDHGIGIPAPERTRIFQKFYRLDPDMTRGVGGTGLGLYICRELVRRMRGRIWVEGAAPGSRFVVELPQAVPVGAEEGPAPDEAAQQPRVAANGNGAGTPAKRRRPAAGKAGSGGSRSRRK